MCCSLVKLSSITTPRNLFKKLFQFTHHRDTITTKFGDFHTFHKQWADVFFFIIIIIIIMKEALLIKLLFFCELYSQNANCEQYFLFSFFISRAHLFSLWSSTLLWSSTIQSSIHGGVTPLAGGSHSPQHSLFLFGCCTIFTSLLVHCGR